MTDAEIRAELRDLGYNDDLSDGQINTAIAHVIRDLKFDYPLQTYGVFDLVADQQIYDLFSAVPDPPTSKGVLPGGIRALEIVWSPSGTDESSTDIFGIGPFLQGLTLGFGEITSFSFQAPGDFVIWDLNWTAYVERFGALFFEHVDAEPGSPVRLYPVPRETGCKAFVKYLKYRTDDELRNEDESTFLMFVQSECASVLARTYACSAGTTFGGAKDDGKTAEYWRREAERLMTMARERFHAHLYTGFSAADRT